MEKGKIQWHEWSDEAFKKAKAEDKPILLAISAVWCHWCHVQDHTTYSDPGVIDLINNNVIPVRVDTDRRPDINRRYNMGGWPTTAFLTPDGDVITGATYIPPPDMKEAVRQVTSYYKTNKEQIASKVSELKTARASYTETAGKVDRSIIEDMITTVTIGFDPIYGGFGMAPKFPHTDALEFALEQYLCGGDKTLLTIVTKTLDEMASGGMYDHEAGGFFRYSTTQDWHIPHFEKMSEDTAKLLAVYLHAYQVTGKESYRSTAEGIVNYVVSTLSDQREGGFYGSQDADEEYYKLKLPEREKMKAPYVDRTLYSNWNAVMASSFIEASFILNRPELLDFAKKSLDRVWKLNYVKGQGVYHYADGTERGLPGLLSDQAHMAGALLLLHQATGKMDYLSNAQEVIDYSIKTLEDGQNGSFFDSPQREEGLGALKRRYKAIDENAVMAEVLNTLHSLTDNEMYGQKAEKALGAFGESYQSYEIMAAKYASAADLQLNGPLQIHIMAPKEEATTREFISEAFKVYRPHRLVQVLDPAVDKERVRQLGYPANSTPLAYVCVGRTCLPPVKEPAELAERIRSFKPSA